MTMSQSVSVAIVAGSKSDQADNGRGGEDPHGARDTERGQVPLGPQEPRGPEGIRDASRRPRSSSRWRGLRRTSRASIASMGAQARHRGPGGVKLNGLDSLLSIVQMPPGVPVACVGIDNARNAGDTGGGDPRTLGPGDRGQAQQDERSMAMKPQRQVHHGPGRSRTSTRWTLTTSCSTSPTGSRLST